MVLSMSKENNNTFETIIPHTFNVEGGISAESAYGIDVKAWNKEYKEAIQISNKDGVAAAKKYATDFYKKNFWDARHMNDVPNETRDIVFDTTVNHSYNFSELVIAASKHGASRDELLEMRKVEYNRLAHSNSDKYGKNLNGWLNRLETFKTEGAVHYKSAPRAKTGAVQPYTEEEFSSARPDDADEENQTPFLAEFIKTNPVLGLFLMIFGMMTGLISPADGNKLLGDFDKLPDTDPRKKAALDNLSPEDKQNYDSMRRLRDVAKDLHSTAAADRTKELAEKFVGQKEDANNNNYGDIVRLSGIAQGQPWCGGFAHYIFGVTMPNVYDQKDYASAISFQKEGEKYGAFHKKSGDYTPEIGDAIVFSRAGGSGHVGIVTKIENGKVTYIAGNDGNKVDSNDFDAATPPANLLGFTSSRELAAAKHIDLGNQASVSEPTTSTNIQTSIIPKDVQLLANAVPKVNITEDKPAAINTPVNLASLGITTDTLYSSLPALVRKKSVNAIG